MQQGGTLIGTVMKSLEPDERTAVTAAVIKRMGLAAPGKQNELGDLFSSQTFLTNWNKMSPQAKMSLFPNPGLRDDLNTIASAAGMMKEGSAVFANPSGTAGAMLNSTSIGAFMAALFTGRWGAAAGIAAGLGGAQQVSRRLLTNPEFVDWLAKTTTMPRGLLPAQMNQIAQYAQSHWSAPDKAALDNYLSGIANAQSPQSSQSTR
jgi:hypothetical protein